MKDKKELKILIIVIGVIATINSFIYINRTANTIVNNQWSGECYMQNRKQSTQECLKEKEIATERAERFLAKNGELMKWIAIACIVTTIVAAATLRKFAYTAVSAITIMLSALVLIM